MRASVLRPSTPNARLALAGRPGRSFSNRRQSPFDPTTPPLTMVASRRLYHWSGVPSPSASVSNSSTAGGPVRSRPSSAGSCAGAFALRRVHASSAAAPMSGPRLPSTFRRWLTASSSPPWTPPGHARSWARRGSVSGPYRSACRPS